MNITNSIRTFLGLVVIAGIISGLAACKKDDPANELPIALFTASPLVATVGETITFTDQSGDADGTIDSWTWDFGDGNTSTDQNPTHVYSDAGTFSVTLTVTDNDGTTSAASQDITINAFALVWSYKAGDNISPSAPALGDDGSLYFGSQDGNVYGINPDGTQKWSFTTGDKVRSTPAIGSDGTVYVGSLDDNFYALDPATGAQKWAFTTGGNIFITSPAIGADGTIYIGC